MGARRESYTRTVVETARLLRKLQREYSPEQMAEICEAWIKVGIVGLEEATNWDTARDLVRHTIGATPIPGNKPKLELVWPHGNAV